MLCGGSLLRDSSRLFAPLKKSASLCPVCLCVYVLRLVPWLPYLCAERSVTPSLFPALHYTWPAGHARMHKHRPLLALSLSLPLSIYIWTPTLSISVLLCVFLQEGTWILRFLQNEVDLVEFKLSLYVQYAFISLKTNALMMSPSAVEVSTLPSPPLPQTPASFFFLLFF